MAFATVTQDEAILTVTIDRQGRLNALHSPAHFELSAIFDTFDDEAGRTAHLNGKVAAALMEKAKAGDLSLASFDVPSARAIAQRMVVSDPEPRVRDAARTIVLLSPR